MDGYLRVQAIPARRDAPDDVPPLSPSHLWPDAPDDLLFVDVEPSTESWPGRLMEGLRFAPEEAFLRAERVIVRTDALVAAGDLDPAAEYISQRWHRTPLLGTVFLKPGMAAPQSMWHDGEIRADDPASLARCRNAELDALLRWGKSLWTPSGYHYRLPSGEHRATFVRLADAIRQPRDADVLAWWLLPHFCTPHRALVLDSSSLLPLVLALRARLEQYDIPLGNVGVRDAYPETPIEDRALIEHVGGEGIVAVVSVSSTGTSVESLAAALADRRSVSPWRLEVLVSRTAEAARGWDPVAEPSGLVAPWARLPEDNSPVDPDQPYLSIDPQTFSNTVIPEPAIATVLDPPHRDREIANLLSFYDAVDGVGVECEHHDSTIARRGRNRGAVRFYPEKLLLAGGFIDAAEARFKSPTERWEDGRPTATMKMLRDVDALVFLDEDADLPGFDAYVDMISRNVAKDRDTLRHIVVTRRPEVEDNERLRDQLEGCSRVLILGLGLVTGGTLQELDVRILRACTGRGRDELAVVALAIHARPASFDEWQAARSSFHQKLAALWVTYLPWRSPLQAEVDLLNLLPPSGEEVDGFIEQRYDVVNNEIGDWSDRRSDHEPGHGVANPAAILWGPDQDAPNEELPRLLGGSRFGHEASMVATYVGVGAVMHRARLERRKQGGPPWLRFDLTKTNFSYFEAIISASILRWLRPSEGQWDSESKHVEDLIREMWERAGQESAAAQRLLVAELLLASAQGKVPRAVFPLLRRLADELLTAHRDDAEAIRTGLSLLDFACPDAREAG